LSRFPRHGDNFATRDIPPDLRDKSPDQIARAMAERLAHARMIEAELAAEGDGFVTIYPPRDQERMTK